MTSGTRSRSGSAGASAASRRPDLDRLSCIDTDGSRIKIDTADVRGRFQVRKRVLWVVLIAVYLALPWLEVGGRPAILADITRRHFYLFGHTFNAQDFWLAFFVLTGIGFTLFVVSALFGRIWCGYACPQTVFLEGVFRRVERLFEGSAAQRKRAAAGGMTAGRIARRAGKYLAWLAIAVVLAHTLLGYFMPVREVLGAITGPPSAHPVAFAFVALTTAIVYFDLAWFREQLCIVICPYGRLQSVLYDEDTVVVGYDRGRGEPRGRRDAGSHGHCIDCFRCVAVCPTGIDIRNGTQLECVGCANCIDACDEVMDKVGQPPGLIRYDSQRGFEQGLRRFWRPRVALYAVLLAVGVTVFAVAATHRASFEANLSRLQGPPYTLQGGRIRNALRLHLVNKGPAPVTFGIQGEPGPGLVWTAPLQSVTLESLAGQHVPLFVTQAQSDFQRGRSVRVAITAGAEHTTLAIEFLGPEVR